MQKRPHSLIDTSDTVNLIYVPVPLEPDFPVSRIGTALHFPDSEPLTLLHYHDSLELGYCYEGSGVFIVNDKIMPFSKGCASIIFKNELHIAKSNPEDLGGWIFINIDPFQLLNNFGFEDLPLLCACLEGSPAFYSILSEETSPILTTIICNIIEELRHRKPMQKYAIKGLVIELLVNINRLIPADRAEKKSFPRPSMMSLSPALDYIFHHYHQPSHISELATLCNMSVTHYRRTFKRTLGVSPLEYIHHLRIRMASVLLAGTDLPILEISMQVGYDTLSSFNRQFKQIMKISPREWRRERISLL